MFLQFTYFGKKIEQGTVMAHDQQRRVTFLYPVIQTLSARRIKMIGRFVHEYDRGIMNIHTCQKNTGLFSAAKQMHWVGQGKLA